MHLKAMNVAAAITSCIILLPVAAPAQIPALAFPQAFLPPDEARDIFNAGLTLYDQYRFRDALNRFQEVIQKFPKNPIADRADYYLIRTLAQTGKKNDALTRIESFSKQYPRSKWIQDVQELRIQLTNQIPPHADAILLRSVAPSAAQRVSAAAPAQAAVPLPPPAPPSPAPFIFGGLQISALDPEVSLQQEIMRAMFRNNADHALDIAEQRLKANPADPVVLSNLNMIAAMHSADGSSMLLDIAKNSPNVKARRDAIFWLAESGGDKDAVVDMLVQLLPALNEEDAASVPYALSRIRTGKSVSALANIAGDKSKSDGLRRQAVYWLGQVNSPEANQALERLLQEK